MANDITFSSGAFGPREDAAFKAVTDYALEERLPLIYLAANSGARVGLANEVKQKLQANISFAITAAVHARGIPSRGMINSIFSSAEKITFHENQAAFGNDASLVESH